MRMINADGLKSELNKAIKNAIEDHCEYVGAFKSASQEWSAEIWTVEDTIDSMPTEEAIPIEWIEKYMQRYILSTRWAFEAMIREWRAERKEE